MASPKISSVEGYVIAEFDQGDDMGIRAKQLAPDVWEEMRRRLSASEINVGPNDILVIHIPVESVPSNRIEDYMRRAKADLQPVFDARGLSGRVLLVPSRDEKAARFSSIRISDRTGTGTVPIM